MWNLRPVLGSEQPYLNREITFLKWGIKVTNFTKIINCSKYNRNRLAWSCLHFRYILQLTRLSCFWNNYPGVYSLTCWYFYILINNQSIICSCPWCFTLTILIMVCIILNDYTFINCKVERRCVSGLCGKFVWTCILSSIIFEILGFLWLKTYAEYFVW